MGHVAGLATTIILLVSTVAPGAIAAEVGDVGFIDGNSLYEACLSKEETYTLVCVDYIAGVADAQTDRVPYNTAAFCIPNGVTKEQVRELVVDWMRANPAVRHMSASIQVTLALKAPYPCPKAEFTSKSLQ